MKKYFTVLLVVISVTGVLNADIFAKKASNVGVSVGSAYSYGQQYILVGISGSYFVMDNLNINLYYRGWFNATPTQNELSVGSTYYIPLNKKIRPFIGVFTRQTFVSGFSDYGSIGARGGFALVNTKNTYASFGYAFEQYTNCPARMECSNSYPEIVFGLSF